MWCVYMCCTCERNGIVAMLTRRAARDDGSIGRLVLCLRSGGGGWYEEAWQWLE